MNEIESIKEGMTEEKVVLIDFMAVWCGPCHMQDPIIEELKKKFGDKIEFKKIDVDKDNDLTEKYSIHAVPTLIIEKNGKMFRKYLGVTHASLLEKDIIEALGR